jgi:predicted Ser/Thr protein kinase
VDREFAKESLLMINPILSVFLLGAPELLILLCAAFLGLAVLIVGAIFMVRHFRRKRQVPPRVPPVPPPAATVAVKECPQCHRVCAPDSPEGLCPQCLAQVGLGSDISAPGATININPLAESAPGTRVPPAPVDLAAQFPQLEILELLGVGGMGMVYKARQPRLDRFVALKILPTDSNRGASFAERFEREAKALAKLNHPGIVAIYDFGQTGQYYYFVMEYVDGMNLRQLLNTQTLESRQALELVTQICTALQFAHDEGVVHRDIKPENILLNKKGQVKIADFGLAKLLGAAPDTALTMSQAAMGTFNYMAPEQRENAQKVDHRADIYSLGVVFYEMLTGEVPMGRFEAPSKRARIDVRLDEVVLHALEREPARRYQHVSEVKTGVETIASTLPSVPVAAKSSQDVSGRPVPCFFWWRAYGIFFVGWLATKLLWNFRSPGCWFACSGMAALVVWVSLARIRLLPEALSSYQKMAPWRKVVELVVCFLNLMFGFVFLISGLFNYWEQSPLHSSVASISGTEYAALFKGKEYRLLQGFAAFTPDIPTVEMVENSSPHDGLLVGWAEHGPGHHYTNLFPNLFLGCLCILLLPYGLIGGMGLTGMKFLPFAWLPARASLAVSAVVLGSLLPICAFSTWAGVAQGGYDFKVTRDFNCKTNIDGVIAAIQKWVELNGYAMGDDDNWVLNSTPKWKPVGEVRLREAWKPSPFDRWRSTLTTFHRISPGLSFVLVSSENPVETHITVQSDLGGETGIPPGLISVLVKLQSDSSQAPGDKDVQPSKAH